MRISRAAWDELIAHAREEEPNECCGYMRISDGATSHVVRAENIHHSPTRFELGFKDLQAANELEDEGFGVAIYHSHPRSPAEPSQTDINVAQYPDWLYLIISLAADPEVRAWRIRGRKVEEEELVVDG